MTAPSKKNALLLDAGKLPSTPHVLLKLIEACHRPDVSFEELSSIIQQDAALSAKVIAAGNSPLYAQWQEIKDFNRLLVVLGLGTIRRIAVTTAVYQFFSQLDADDERLLLRLWHRTLFCAHAATGLARLIDYDAGDEVYLAGLLHRVGQLVLLREAPDEYSKRLLTGESGADLVAWEHERFGTSHAEVGARLIEGWGLESFLSDAVLFQDESATAILDAPRLVKLINLSHKLAESRGDSVFEQADLLFGLSQPLLEDLLLEVERQVQQAAQAMGIRIPLGESGAAEAEFREESQQIQLELAKRVRDIALLGGVVGEGDKGGDLAAVIHQALRDLAILFGLSRGVCFVLDSEGGELTLVGQGGLSSKSHQEFNIAFQSGRGLVAETLLRREILSSFATPEGISSSVVDHQLAKRLGASGLICVPLFSAHSPIGVLVAGLVEEQHLQLSTQHELVACFASEVARLMQACSETAANQERLLESQRAEGHLHARALVHEANNPLGIIRNYLELLADRVGEDESTQQQLKVLNEEIDRVAAILLRMRDVPQVKEVSTGEVDINKEILDLMSVFRLSLFGTHAIQDELVLDEALPPLLSNRNSLKQVLTNLVKNAVEAMPEGGKIQISTRGGINLGGEPHVELRVVDNGPGIPQGVMNNLFKPVASTKGKRHSGLGLTIVKQLVSDLQGTISCRSQEDSGTEFQILLPLTKEG